jgi:hypothetical protein
MTMDHADALEHIEIAAVEPDGLERLMAGDTPDAAAVAGHLAGCPSCTRELARIRDTAALVRRAVQSLPDPALRDRTLAFVRAVGRDRSVEPSARSAAPGSSIEPPRTDPPFRVVSGGRRRLATFSRLAAAVLIAGVLGFAAAGVVRAPVTDTRDGEIAVLSAIAQTTLRIEQRADATRVVLAAVDGRTGVTGTLLFSPSDGELVMVAEGLAPAPEGQEYGCWIEVDGVRQRIGRMYAGGDVEGWAGPVDGLADLPPGAVFGVSLVPVGGGVGEPVLTGRF